jgi:hypothetical protein
MQAKLDALEAQATAYSNSGNFDRCIELFTELIRLDPRAAHYFNCGSCYYQKDDYARALVRSHGAQAGCRYRCPHCGAQGTVPGQKHGFLGLGIGLLVNLAMMFSGDSPDECPWCHANLVTTDTTYCPACTHYIPPYVET